MLAPFVALGIGTAVAWRCTMPGNSDVAFPRATAIRDKTPVSVASRLIQGVVWIGALCLVVAWVLEPLRASLACRRGDHWLSTDLGRAVTEYQGALAHAPEDDFYWAHLGAVIRANLDRAASRDERRWLVELGRDTYARAAALVPVNAFYHVGLGRSQMELARLHLARPEQALAEYDRALRLDENNAMFYADAANSALVLEQLERADQYATHGCTRYPNFGLLHAHRGYVAYLRGHLAEAIRIVAESLQKEWYREESSRQFAERLLDKAKHQIASSPP
jgi:tetratricopeptide (TPR) repeat protein